MVIALQVIGFKKTGKTTTVQDFLELANQYHIKTAVLKDDAHTAALDPENTDTHKFHEAGAAEIILRSKNELFIRLPRDPQKSYTPKSLLSNYLEADIPLVLIEGFKSAELPKIALIKTALDKTALPNLNLLTYASLWPEKIFEPVMDFSTKEKRQAWFQHWLITEGLIQ